MRKKILSLLCLGVALVLTVLPLTAMANSPSMFVRTNNGGKLHLREQPKDHSNNVLLDIPYGAVVDVLGYEQDGNWAHVQYDQHIGYVMSRYLSVDNPGSYKKPTADGSKPREVKLPDFSRFVQITPYDVLVRPSKPNGFVNLRWAPSLDCRVIMRCYANYPLTVIAQDSHWAQVKDEATGCVGFMYRNFLSYVLPAIGQGATVQ